jgi:hypothetical protein
MLPPTIPTSFIPHSAPAQSAHRSSSGSTGILSFFAFLILGIVFVLAIGVFLYGRILAVNESAKSEELAKEEAKINPEIISGFIRLRDRLNSGEKLLAEHVAFSGFFSLLGELIPSTVRFNSMHLSIDNAGTVKLEGLGGAKSFNALAATSQAFAQDGRIKDAIFSNITVDDKDSSVSFALAASLDPKIVFFSLETIIPDIPDVSNVPEQGTSDATSTPTL